jgi:hypothetical protein
MNSILRMEIASENGLLFCLIIVKTPIYFKKLLYIIYLINS